MSLQVLALVLLASLIHAFWNFLAKKSEGGLAFIWLVYVFGAVLFVPLVVYLTSSGQLKYSQPLVWFSLASAIVHLAYFIVLQTGYRKGELSVVYPLARGSGPLLSSMAAILFLGERLSALVALGLLLIVAGVLVITKFSFRMSKDEKLMKGVWYGLATGALIACYTLVDNVAVKRYDVSPVIITLASNLFGLIALIPFISRQGQQVKQTFRSHKWTILAVAVLSPVAYILVLIALRQAPLVVVAPARESSILFGVFMGSALLNEKESRRRALASLLIIGGIVCLAFSH